MPLPKIIEIIPMTQPILAEITVPGSKSITNRALILAALSGGLVTLRGALWSEDTQIMTEALQRLGFEIKVLPDEKEFCNRTIVIRGLGGKIPNGGTKDNPLELFVGNAGTAARFLAAFVCLGDGVYRLHGVPRMHERPQAALFHALRELGYRVDSSNDKLPATLFGAGPRVGSCMVSIDESSQFASALLLCAAVGGWTVGQTGEAPEEAPYVVLTQQIIKAFPKNGGTFQIEPDASSASYFCAVNWLTRLHLREQIEGKRINSHQKAHELSQLYNQLTPIRVAAFPKSNWQIDAAFPDFLPLPESVSRQSQLGDSIMTGIVLAPFAGHPTRFTHLERMRAQECERVASLRTELTKCGAKVVEEDHSLTVFPSAIVMHGASIETYNDHRMAMCFAILGFTIPGIKIENPSCVKKTFPNFFQKLAGPPPNGLGITIQNPETGQKLSGDELFAD